MTWDEYVASGRKGEVRGMEDWREPKAPEAVAEAEPTPKPGIPGMLRQPRILPGTDPAPGVSAPKRQRITRTPGVKDAILALLERSPDSSIHDVAARAYGANTAENRKKATSMLDYLRNTGKVSRIGADKFRLVQAR
jgi:hypothetical protein